MEGPRQGGGERGGEREGEADTYLEGAQVGAKAEILSSAMASRASWILARLLRSEADTPVVYEVHVDRACAATQGTPQAHPGHTKDILTQSWHAFRSTPMDLCLSFPRLRVCSACLCALCCALTGVGVGGRLLHGHVQEPPGLCHV